MAPEILVLYIGMLATIAGVVFQFVQTWRQGRADKRNDRKAEAVTAKDFAGAAESVAKGADALVAHYEKQVSELRTEVKEMRKEVKSLRAGVALLIKQLREKGIDPVWVPTENGNP